jgi:hypothetical protein
MSEQKPNTTVITNDINNIFDDFIKKGFQPQEKEIFPGITIKLKPLSYNEMAKAEAEISRQNPDVPADVTVKLRCGKILSYAMTELNGTPIEDKEAPENNMLRRIALYDRLMNGPTDLVQEAYRFYLETVRAENEYYRQPIKEIEEGIENF